jgi:hypothetical protein
MAYNEDYGIQKFYTLARQASGFARDMQMRVTSFIINGIEQLTPEELIFVRTGNIPTKTITPQTVQFMGTSLQLPGGVTFENPWAVDFYCTQDYNVRKLLELSMSNTMNPRTNTGDIEPRDLETYKIQLSLLNDKMVPIRVYTLYGAFVTSLGNISYNATAAGAILNIGASISYQFWEAQDTEEGNLRPVTGLTRSDSPNTTTTLQNILGL